MGLFELCCSALCVGCQLWCCGDHRVELQSKLPDVGTTIFTVMSALAAKESAINLSQGFPDYEPPQALLDAVTAHFHKGRNQYPPMTGVPELRNALQTKVRQLYGAEVCQETEITITSGATEALFCAIAAVVQPGDEVIVFDPAYDSYEPAIRLAGGVTKHVSLQAPDFVPDWDRVAQAVSPKTRLIVLNTPHNPTGAVWREQDMHRLKELVRGTSILLLGDEVYEHMVFDGHRHLSLCADPELLARSFVVSSFGKTYHATGWKIGYCIAPAALSREFRKVHQYVTFTTITPVQLGLAEFLDAHPEHHLELSDFYQVKRDLCCDLLASSRFRLTPSSGTYFQLLDYQDISDEPDTEFVMRLTREHKVAAIPVSVFNADGSDQRLIRLCFAKDEATLRAGAEILCQL